MTGNAIVVCEDARSDLWLLGPMRPAMGGIVLIGWRLERQLIDAGMPPDVGMILARGLTSLGTVTFPVSALAAADRESGRGQTLRPATALATARAYLRRGRLSLTVPEICFLSTRDAGVAVGMYDQTDWPWELQGQAAILSPHDSAPPVLAYDDAVSLLGDEWTGCARSLHVRGALGLLRPGFDGDIVGILCLTPAFRAAVLSTMEREAHRAGFGWSPRTEADMLGQSTMPAG